MNDIQLIASLITEDVDILDEGFRDKLYSGLAGAGIAAATMFGGSGCDNKNYDAEPVASSQSSDLTQFCQTGIWRDGSDIVVRTVEEHYKVARAKAYNQLAQHLGTNQLPPGIEQSHEELEGLHAVTLRWSQERNSAAKSFR